MPPTEHLEHLVSQLAQDVAELQAQRLRVKLRDVLERVALVLLVGIIGLSVWKGLPIHYIQEGGPGYSKPGELPPDMARDYATRFVETRYTFIPSTFKAQMEKCLQWMHPALHTRFNADAAEEEREVKKHDIKVQVFLDYRQRLVTPGNPDTAKVALTGLRAIWVGETYREEVFKAEITIIPLRPKSPLVPWGKPGPSGHLVVARSAYTPVLSAIQK